MHQGKSCLNTGLHGCVHTEQSLYLVLNCCWTDMFSDGFCYYGLLVARQYCISGHLLCRCFFTSLNFCTGILGSVTESVCFKWSACLFVKQRLKLLPPTPFWPLDFGGLRPTIFVTFQNQKQDKHAFSSFFSLHSSQNYWQHLGCVQTSATPQLPLRKYCLKVCPF